MSEAHSQAAGVHLPERTKYLWLLATPPALWAAHFLLTYITAAIFCAKYAGRDGSLRPVHVLVLAYTAAALVAIGTIGAGARRRHGHGSETAPHDSDTPEDRHRFLGFATMLLAGLSAVAVIYDTVSVLLVQRCH